MSLLSLLRSRRLAPAVAAADPTLLLVDVRSPDEYRSGHAPTAINVPLGGLERRLAELASGDRTIAFICQSGTRSAMAVRAARRTGIEARNVSGGMHAWRRARLPIETGKSRQRQRRR